MSSLSLQLIPDPAVVGPAYGPQGCYTLTTVQARGDDGAHPVNWALVADASRSMRIPIVDEAQFRALVQASGAQETLVDDVPVWQLQQPHLAEPHLVGPSALDYVARALHTVVERMDNHDRVALVACATQALLTVPSTAGDQRGALAHGIGRLRAADLGETTDLARGLELGLHELRRGRDGRRADRMLLLTDGFTQRPEACLHLAAQAAAEGVSISTIGLGGEFQEDVLLALADRSGGRAVFLRQPDAIPQAIEQELTLARAAAVRSVEVRVAPATGVLLRRVTRIRPVLTSLFDSSAEAKHDGIGSAPPALFLGDVATTTPTTLLLEWLVPPQTDGTRPMAEVTLLAGEAVVVRAPMRLMYRSGYALPNPVLDAAARANVARLQQRAMQAATTGAPQEAARLLRAAAERLDGLGEHPLAEAARQEAATLAQVGRTTRLAAKELTYATRRMGDG